MPIPGGGLYFVFQTGEPRFRRYNADGTLLFERAIQGRELDALVQSQPTTWPERPGRAAREIPIVRPVVRVAAVDARGQLWIGFTVPFTYVYDGDGEKVRTVAVPRRGGADADQPLLHPGRQAAGDPRLLRVPPVKHACKTADRQPTIGNSG